MYEIKHPKQIRILEPFIFFVIAILVILYAISALNTGDWLWFAGQNVDATPDRIVIWDHGEKIVLQPGHENFNELATAVHESLHDFSNTDLISLGFGEDTLDYYETNGVMVELFYNNPVAYRASFRVGQPTHMLVPLEGRHAGNDYFFRGDQGTWWFGAMRMADSEPLYAALSDLGYWQPN